MESGTPFNKGTYSGWLNRAVGLLGHEAATPFQAVSLTTHYHVLFMATILLIAISATSMIFQSRCAVIPWRQI